MVTGACEPPSLPTDKLTRLVVPFFLLTLLLASYGLRTIQPYSAILLGEVLFYGLALLGLVGDTPLLRRIAGPPSALVLLNAAAAVALFMFVFRRRSLLELWVPAVDPAEERARAA